VVVTCLPKHGPDRGVETAARLRQLGRSLTVNVAARMVRDHDHLDQLLADMAGAGIEDLFLIGGDVEEPLGEYSSAVELLELVAGHPDRPELIGIAGYPEGHPLISDEELERALRAKSRLADYVVTQMCFDTEALRGWIERERRQGMELPVVIGMPGKVTRRKLLRMATRIGVGPSVDFLRKQKGLRALLSRRSTADRLFDGIVPLLDDPQLAVAGLQYFTFNELLQTWEWHQKKGFMRHDSEQLARSS
jgi:methylenetetrahydrofolate reductase (NADPH)